MYQRFLLICFLTGLFNSLIVAQNLLSTEHDSHPIVSLQKIFNGNSSSIIEEHDPERLFSKIGLLVGWHSPGLTEHGIANINSDIFIEGYLKFLLSNEVYLAIAFTYWKSRSDEINTPIVYIPSETIIAKGFKLDLDFTIVKISCASLSLGPSVSIEKITNITNAVFSLGSNLKLNIPLLIDKINIIPVVGYKTGAEALNFGGGMRYSFLYYLLGIEYNI
jgi:hypothetical protein